MSIVSNEISAVGTKATSDNTLSQIFSLPVSTGQSGFILFRVVCQRLSDGATKSWALNAGFKKPTSSDASVSSEILGSVLGTSGDLLALALATASISTDSDNVIFNVKGLSSTNMIWYATAEGSTVEND